MTSIPRWTPPTPSLDMGHRLANRPRVAVGELSGAHAPAVDGDVPRGRGDVAVGVVGGKPGHVVQVDDGAGLASRQGAALVVHNPVPERDGDGLALNQRLGRLFSGLRLLHFGGTTTRQHKHSKPSAHGLIVARAGSPFLRAARSGEGMSRGVAK